MSHEAGGTVPGAIRFGMDGHLEMFDGAEWAPLQRLSDADLPPVMRNIGPVPPPTSDDAAGGAPGGVGDADDEAHA